MEVEKLKPCNIKQAPKEISPQSLHHASSSDGMTIVEASKKEESIINHINDNDNVDDGYLDSFPPGYRFCPLDEELVLYYLKKKVMNLPLPRNRIMEVNLYRHNPEKLAEQYKQHGEKEWYFFTPRDKKYPNGTRPNRAAGDGYWKATGADREVKFQDRIVGYRKVLVFYKGKPPKGDKTSWIMHEYRVSDPPCKKERGYNDMRLDDWVLCRIYKKDDKSVKTQSKNEDRLPLIQNEYMNDEIMASDDKMHCSNYFNTMGSFTNQSFPEEALISFQPMFNEQFTPSFSTKYLNDILGEDLWSAANFDFHSQLDVCVEPLINLDLSTDTSNETMNSGMNRRD